MRLDRARHDRRKVLAGSGLGLIALLLAACTTYGKKPEAGTEPVAGPTSGAASPPATTPPQSPGTVNAIATTSQVPVGSGLIVDEVVLTQPEQGVFKGLSAICTHAGCTVNQVEGGAIICPCHGSRYNLDGSVTNGPATRPLESKAISVQGDSIVLG